MKVLTKTVLARNTYEMKNNNKLNIFQFFLKTDKSFKNIHSDSAGILHAKIVACEKVNIFSVICIKKRVRYATRQSKQNRKKDYK